MLGFDDTNEGLGDVGVVVAAGEDVVDLLLGVGLALGGQ